MTTDERKKFNRLRRTLGWMIVICLSLIIYLKGLKEDLENSEYDKKILNNSLERKIEHINKLYYLVDSIKKNQAVIKEKPVKTTKIRKREKTDTLTTRFDTIIDTESDSIQKDNFIKRDSI